METIKLGGEERQLRFSHIAMKSMEEHYGMGFNKIFKKVDMESMKNMGVMLWACMKRYDKSISLETVEELLDDAIEDGDVTFTELGSIIERVMKNSTLVQQAGKAKEAKNKKGA